ncbi:hypothetical protein NY70_001936 [Salmonella enterica subsp. enterica]|nr:hypothetical protein [Salmonella enterica subsp. enterica]
MSALSAGGVMQIFFVCGSVSKNMQKALWQRQSGDGHLTVLTFVVITVLLGVSDARSCAGDKCQGFAVFATGFAVFTKFSVKDTLGRNVIFYRKMYAYRSGKISFIKSGRIHSQFATGEGE